MVSGAVQSSPPHLLSSCRMSTEPHNGSLPPFGDHRKAHTTIPYKSLGPRLPFLPFTASPPTSFPQLSNTAARRTCLDAAFRGTQKAPSTVPYAHIHIRPVTQIFPQLFFKSNGSPWTLSRPMRQFVGLKSVDSNSRVNHPRRAHFPPLIKDVSWALASLMTRATLPTPDANQVVLLCSTGQ